MLHGTFEADMDKHKYYLAIAGEIFFAIGGSYLCPQEEHQVTDEVISIISVLP